MAVTRGEAVDPVVDVIYDRGAESEERVRPTGTLSHFLTTFCLWEILQGKGRGFGGPGDIEPVRKKFGEALCELWTVDVFDDPDRRHGFHLLDGKALLLQTQNHHSHQTWWTCNIKGRTGELHRWMDAFATRRQAGR